MRWLPAGPLDRLADDTAVHVDLAGHPVCLARSRGTAYAMPDECSHGQVLLSEGDVEDGYVECWLHGSRFDLAIGVPTGPPAHAAGPCVPGSHRRRRHRSQPARALTVGRSAGIRD